MERVEIPLEKIIETYVSGGARLVTLLYSIEAEKRGLPVLLPSRPQAERYSIGKETARAVVNTAASKAAEVSINLFIPLRSRLTADTAMRLIQESMQVAQEGGVKKLLELVVGPGWPRTLIPLSLAPRLAALEAKGRGLEPVIVFMTSDLPHMVIFIQLLIIKWLAGRLQEAGVRPRIVMLLWREEPGEVPSDGGRLSLVELARLVLDGMEVEITIVDPGSLEPDPNYWRLYEFIAAAHSTYYMHGITTPHNLLANIVLEETGTYLAAQNRGLALVYALASRLGFPFHCKICYGRPLYIYVGGLTYYATVKLLLDSLILSHPLISEALELKLVGDRYKRVAEDLGWPLEEDNYYFTVHVYQIKRIAYLWDTVSMLRKAAYRAMAEGDREAALLYESLTERGLEAALERLARVTASMQLARVNGSVRVEPETLKAALEALKALQPVFKEAARLAVSRSWERLKIDVIACRTILEGLSHPLDLAFLYQVINARELGLEADEATGMPSKISMPLLGFKAEEKISFRRCGEALRRIMTSTELLQSMTSFLEDLIAKTLLK